MPPLSERTFQVNQSSTFKLFRLFVTGMEVTQAIQHYDSLSHLTDPLDRRPDNSLRLVANKPAWVRGYVVGRNIPGVTGTLEIWRRSAGFIWTSVATLTPEPPASVTALPDPDYVAQRGSLESTLNFVIPADVMCGTLRLVLRVSGGRWNDTLTRHVSVTLRQTLKLAGVLVSYNGPSSIEPGSPNRSIAAPTLTDLQATSEKALTLYPVEATARFRAAGTFTFSAPLDDEIGGNCTPNWDALLAKVAEARIADGNQEGWIYYGLLPSGTPTMPVIGCGGGGVAVGVKGSGGSMAHEVGHACGLKHAPAGSPSNPDPNYPTYEPYPSGSIGEYGLDISNGHVSSPTKSRDFMSNGAFKWISPYNHGRLIENPRLNPKHVCVDLPWFRDVVWRELREVAQPPVPEPPPFGVDLPVFASMVSPTNVIALVVRIARGVVVAQPAVRRTKMRALIDGSVATPLLAQLRSKKGDLLAEGALRQVPTSSCGCGKGDERDAPTDSYLAHAFIPDVAPGHSVEIRNGDTVLWKKQAPSTAVAVVDFAVQINDDGQVTANWATKGEPNECWLLYSYDDQTWQVVATGLTGRSATIDSCFLPEGRVRLQLIAHDGFFSSRSFGVEVRVPSRRPDIAILHPHAASTHLEGRTLRLWGAATAANGRPLTAGECSWTLNGKSVGQGADVWIAAPAAGTHTVQFRVRDGGHASAVTTSFVTTELESTSGSPHAGRRQLRQRSPRGPVARKRSK